MIFRRLIPMLFLALLSFALRPATAQPHAAAVSGDHVYALTKEYLAAAPKRYVGSPGHLAAAW